MSGLDLTGRRVLVVEDDYLLAAFLRGLLESWGATLVGPAPTSERALALLAGTRIDFALLDVNLGGEPVFSVADALAAERIPFSFTTGYETSMIPERHRNALVLRKPFGEAAVEEALLPLAI